MYFVVNAETNKIMESYPGDYGSPDLQQEADIFQVPVYIIRGERTSLIAEPSPVEPEGPEID